jgi:hypothetical protein
MRRLDDAVNHIYRRADRVSDARSAAPHSRQPRLSMWLTVKECIASLATAHSIRRRDPGAAGVAVGCAVPMPSCATARPEKNTGAANDRDESDPAVAWRFGAAS